MSPWIRNIVLIILLAVLIAVVGFRVLASSRESHDPETVAGPGALFAEVRGLRIQYKEWGPKTGKPILLVPGAMAWSGTWRALAEPLAEAGNRVIAFDLPPFGMSDRPSAGVYSRASQAALVVGFADAMRLDRFTLVGHSFGAGATVETAFGNADRIERLVLISGAIEPGKKPGGSLARIMLGLNFVRPLVVASTFTNPLAINIGLKSLVSDSTIVTPELADLYSLPLYMAGTTRAVGDWLITGFHADESETLAADRENFRRFTKSVLLIWGAEDKVTPVGIGETLAGYFPASNLEILGAVGHLPHVEKPAEVADLIADFMGGAMARPRPADTPEAGKPMPIVSAAPLRGTVDSD